MTLNYLQFPFNFQYKYALNGGNNLLFQGGPYLGYGLGGKIKAKASALGFSETEEESIEFGSDGDFKYGDFGLGLGVGMLFKNNLQLGLGYNFGLVNIGADVDGMKNRGVALTLTYMFSKK